MRTSRTAAGGTSSLHTMQSAWAGLRFCKERRTRERGLLHMGSERGGAGRRYSGIRPQRRTGSTHAGTVDRSYLNLFDPLHAVAGNNLLIDHGNGEIQLARASAARLGPSEGRGYGHVGAVIGKVGSSGLSEHPHLHYQLMSGTHLTRSDGLPSQFVNVWLEDTRAREPVQIKVPKRGIQLGRTLTMR